MGEGIIAELYKGIIGAFSPLNKVYDLDPIPCLPDPNLPNIQRYIELGKCDDIIRNQL